MTPRTQRSLILVKVRVEASFFAMGELTNGHDVLPQCYKACGARYKTRPGLTYHYTHSHKNLLEDDDEDSGAATPTTGASNSGMSSASVTPLHPSMQMAGQGMMTPGHGSDSPAGVPRFEPSTGYSFNVFKTLNRFTLFVANE